MNLKFLYKDMKLYEKFMNIWIYKQETLRVVTIVMICSSLVSLWKFQHFQRPIYNPVQDLWWNLYCENSKPYKYIHKKACVSLDYSSVLLCIF